MAPTGITSLHWGDKAFRVVYVCRCGLTIHLEVYPEGQYYTHVNRPVNHPVVNVDHPVVNADHPVVDANHPVGNVDPPVVNVDHPVVNVKWDDKLIHVRSTCHCQAVLDFSHDGDSSHVLSLI